MPASCSAAPAGCILGLSFFEPMMIPTIGSSTSISSNASSTAGIVVPWVGGGPSLGIDSSIGSSEISLTLVLSGLSGHALGGAGGDVGADLHSVEGDPARRIVCTIAGVGRCRSGGGHVEDASPFRDDIAVLRRGPRVSHLGQLDRIGEAADHVPLRGG